MLNFLPSSSHTSSSSPWSSNLCMRELIKNRAPSGLRSRYHRFSNFGKWDLRVLLTLLLSKLGISNRLAHRKGQNQVVSIRKRVFVLRKLRPLFLTSLIRHIAKYNFLSLLELLYCRLSLRDGSLLLIRIYSPYYLISFLKLLNLFYYILFTPRRETSQGLRNRS